MQMNVFMGTSLRCTDTSCASLFNATHVANGIFLASEGMILTV